MQLWKKRHKRGLSSPLDYKPVLSGDARLYAEVWLLVSGSRTYTMGGAGPVPVSQIKDICDLLHVTTDESQFVLRAVMELDREFLAKVNKNGQD